MAFDTKPRYKPKDSYKQEVMCSKKRKYKSSEASKVAHRFGQRKYNCPICGHWHLTKGNK